MSKRRTYTDQDKARVAVVLASNEGNVNKTARETGIPKQTVRDWKRVWDREGLPAEIESEVPAAADEFLSDVERVRDKALVQLEAAIDAGNLKPRELITALRVLAERSAAVRHSGRAGGDTTNIQINLPSTEEYRAQIAEYVETTIKAAKQRDELIVDATDAEWEQADKKALPPA